MAEFDFTLSVLGSGADPEEAWQDAVKALLRELPTMEMPDGWECVSGDYDDDE
jgi:hypothetical protein